MTKSKIQELNNIYYQTPQISLFTNNFNFPEIKESFLKSKNAINEDCEDGIFVGESIIAVIDGCTAKGNYLWNGKKSGLFAKNLICDTLKNLKVPDNPKDFFEALNITIKNVIARNSIIGKVDWPRASVIAFVPMLNEIWSYGDCRCMVDGQVYLHEKQIDIKLSLKRSEIIEERLRMDSNLDLEDFDFGREAILGDLIKQLDYENVHKIYDDVDYGYPVLNGDKICSDMISVHKVKPGQEVVLATDGYPILRNTLEESERELETLINTDPFCYKKYRSTKGLKKGNISFDDRAYIRFIVPKIKYIS